MSYDRAFLVSDEKSVGARDSMFVVVWVKQVETRLVNYQQNLIFKKIKKKK